LLNQVNVAIAINHACLLDVKSNQSRQRAASRRLRSRVFAAGGTYESILKLQF